MADYNDIRFTKPADRLIEAISVHNKTIEGQDLNAQNLYEASKKVLRDRLGIDEFTRSKK